MRKLNFFLLVAFIGAVLLMGADWTYSRRQRSESVKAAELNASALCGSTGANIEAGDDGKFIKALPGWGGRNYKISTKSDSAQYYFNQGLGFYYGYHFQEAFASFKESSRFDPTCAMAYWGQALSRGPYYNTFVYKMPKEVPEIIVEMRRAAMQVSAKESDLISAMSQRYSSDMSNVDRQLLNRSYASALEKLVAKYPDDSDIKSLYVDAVMLEHKWDFWSNDGNPRPWTNSLVNICESVLKKERHPAIMHYYIHLVEASRTPGRALGTADALKDVNPGIGHMVHMATHMYQRNGLYSEGVRVNEQANAINNVTDLRIPGLRLGQDRSTHFFAVQSFCAMTAGMYKDGLPIYDRARNRTVALSSDLRTDPYGQFVFMMPVLARIRLGKWEEILAGSAPDSTWRYAYVLDQFARGVAHVRHNQQKEANKCLKRINAQLSDSLLAIRYMPFNSPVQSCRIASALLAGEILYSEGKATESFDAFRKAIAEEDKLIYREPHDWVIPARQFLGKYLLKNGKLREAESVYREDLIHNPLNGWSLTGLSQALQKQGKTKDAELNKGKARQAFSSADVDIAESAF
ncbi:hypothetical protein WBG78_08295 [Chryseolinea sp. T2]|uniref:tetratricopeptide repeat protein n=1 Tax=Chryseolinea sp. T2 TaxID=3129255 RepID=UPI003077D519